MPPDDSWRGSTSTGCCSMPAARRRASRRVRADLRRQPATFALGRVALGDAPADAARGRFAVRPQELDPLDHVNNAVYADWLEEAVIGAGDIAATRAIPRRIRLEYALPAEAGATVGSMLWPVDGGWSFRLTGPDGNDLLRARLEED